MILTKVALISPQNRFYKNVINPGLTGSCFAHVNTDYVTIISVSSFPGTEEYK